MKSHALPRAAGAERCARLRHGYTGEAGCSSFDTAGKPPECFAGANDAQAAASVSNLVNNGLTFATASLAGSLSDEHGRKGTIPAPPFLSLVAGFCCF